MGGPRPGRRTRRCSRRRGQVGFPTRVAHSAPAASELRRSATRHGVTNDSARRTLSGIHPEAGSRSQRPSRVLPPLRTSRTSTAFRRCSHPTSPRSCCTAKPTSSALSASCGGNERPIRSAIMRRPCGSMLPWCLRRSCGKGVWAGSRCRQKTRGGYGGRCPGRYKGGPER